MPSERPKWSWNSLEIPHINSYYKSCEAYSTMPKYIFMASSCPNLSSNEIQMHSLHDTC